MRGRVLDVAALVDVATGRTHYTRALVATALDQVIPLAVPSTALTLAWSQVPAQGRLTLAALVEQSITLSFPLDDRAAAPVGELLERSPFGPPDLVAAHVAVIAGNRGWPVVTDRGPQLRALVPSLGFESLP
ncbi:hypothetical protein ABT299_45010 [Spirillospora sp. NPDC000708]